jgi:type VI secretion system secreted protein Hcp
MSFFDDAVGFLKSKAAPVAQRAIGKLKSAAGGTAADYFLKIDGLKGESEDEKHKGEIEVVAFELGAAQVGSGGKGTGSGTGKVAFDDMTVTARVNLSSAQLLIACATGQHFPRATFVGRKAGNGQQEYLKIILSDVLVSSYRQQDQGDGDPVPLDVFTLNFAEIDFEYKPQNANGSLAAPAKVGYDLKKNKKK